MKNGLKSMLLALLAALLGGLAGAVSAGFLHLVEWGQDTLWNVLTPKLPLQTLLVCALGGALVGLCQRFLGDHPKNINEAVTEISQTGRLDYSTMPQGLLTVAVSLIFGASLGPESAIVELLGGLGTWVTDAIRWLRHRLSLPQPIRSDQRAKRLPQNWPALLALVAGLYTFVRLLGGMYSGGFLHLSQSFRWIDLLWSLPLGALGAAAGSLFLALQGWTKKWLAPFKSSPILLGLAAGVVLGTTALFLPMMLFSGQHQLQQAYDQAAQLGFWILLLIGLARLLLVNLLLASGWKGGQFLPIMFSAAALGLSVSVLFPVVSVPAAVLAVMAGLIAVVLPRPLIALVLMALMFPIQYVGISAVAVGLVWLGKHWLAKHKAKINAIVTAES